MEIQSANFGTIDEVDEYRAIIFSDDKKELYFQIQDAYEYDTQDVQLGMDTYYIEINDQSHGCYGGISKIKLKDCSIEIELNDKGNEKLKSGKIKILFSIGKLPEIKKEISRIALKHNIEFSIE